MTDINGTDALVELTAEEHETLLYDTLFCMVDEYADAIREFWPAGDGYGGGLLHLVAQRLGLPTGLDAPPPQFKRRRVSAGTRARVFKRDRYTCQLCRTPGDALDPNNELTLDHIKPVSKGGGNEIENLRTACLRCNVARGNREWE